MGKAKDCDGKYITFKDWDRPGNIDVWEDKNEYFRKV